MIPDAIKRLPSFPMGLLVIYFVGCMFTLANYVAYFRYHEDRYGLDLINAYFAFVITGLVVYACFSAVCWVWALRYSVDDSDRLNKTGYGLIAIFMFHDLPVFILEYHAFLCCGGIYHGLQGTVFVIQWITFILSFVFAWQSYTWIAAHWCNAAYGDQLQEGLKTGQERLNVLPPMPGAHPRSLSRPQSEHELPLLSRDSSVPIPMHESPGRALRELGSGGGRVDARWAPRGNLPIEEPGYRGPSMDTGYSSGRPSYLSSAGGGDRYYPVRDSSDRYMPPPPTSGGRSSGTIYVERQTF